MLTQEVHVWCAPTHELRSLGATETFEAWLSGDEVERHGRFRRPEDRELFLFTRAILRGALSHYADVEPAAWRFVTTHGGRPELATPFDALGLRFSVSHTPGLVACLVSHTIDAGLDIEGVVGRVADVFKLAAVVCSPAEREEMERLPPDAAHARFYELWTLKESYVKARGTGLRLALNKMTFTGGGHDSIAVRLDGTVEDDPRQWQFALWRPTPEHQGALALRRGAGPDRRVVFRSALASMVR
ncbi:MAG: 4'-phosphopantetheinyl transferase family protein [Gemmatimonadaceae bacterium]